MNIRTTTRRVAAAAAVAAPLALIAAAPALAEDEAAAQGQGNSISGVAWLDQNSDGFRDAGEPGFAGHTMYLDGTNTAVKTDANGRYTFTGLKPGLSYRVGSMDRSMLDGHGWSPLRSLSPNGSDFAPTDGKASFVAGEQNADTGLVLTVNDYRTSQIIVSLPDHTTKPVYQVGDVVDIVGSAYFTGNANDQFGARLTLPDGVRKLERIGGMPSYIGDHKPNEVTGFFYDRRYSGLIEFLGARVVVEQPISAADIKLEVYKGVFGKSDPDLANDTMSRPFSAEAAPVTTQPTTEPTTPAPTTEPTTEPTTTAPTTTTTAPVVVPISQNTTPLANTGASALGLIGMGSGLLAAGGGAVLWSGRRKKA
ncbi:SdrD B-like domain-containing protein [Saccharothrix saharensis]|uniref:SdrD B-like domain-containing protein n=1 Tax=Saccharothrix saharensis TaxID=571190 RepID=UPI00368F5EDE